MKKSKTRNNNPRKRKKEERKECRARIVEAKKIHRTALVMKLNWR